MPGEGVVIPFEARDDLSMALVNMAKTASLLTQQLSGVAGALDRTGNSSQEAQRKSSRLLDTLKAMQAPFQKLTSFKVGDAWNQLQNTSVAGLAVGASMVKGSSAAATMENQLARLSLSSKVTSRDLTELKRLSMDLAYTDDITANSIAGVGGKLLKSGQTMQQVTPIMKSLVGVAGGLNVDLGGLGDQAIKTAKSFDVGMGAIPDIMDTVVKVSSETNTTVDSMLGALSRIGPVAKTAGLTIQETAGLIGSFNAAGMSTEQSTMVLQRALMMTSRRGLEFKTIMGELGKAYQASNSQQERAALITQTLGPRALALGNVFMQTGGDVQKMTEKFANATGAVQHMSDVVGGTASEKWELLHNRMNTAFQSVSDKYLPVLSKLLDLVNALPDEVIVGAVVAAQSIGTMAVALQAATNMVLIFNAANLAGTLTATAVAAKLATVAMIGLKTAGVGAALIGGFMIGKWISGFIESHAWLKKITDQLFTLGGMAVMDAVSHKAGREANSFLGQREMGALSKSGALGSNDAEMRRAFAPIIGATAVRAPGMVERRERIKEMIKEIGDSGMKIDKVEFKLDKGATAEDVEKLLAGILRKGRRANAPAAGRATK